MSKIRKRLASMVDLPESSFGACPYVAIESNTSVTVDACLDILSYDECEVRLLLEGLTVTIVGKDLTMRSYGNKTIRIVGIIDGVLFADGRDRGAQCS